MNTESLKVEKIESKRVYEDLLRLGFAIKKDPNPYLEWKVANNTITVMYYSSGKLVVQGNTPLDTVMKVVLGGEVSSKIVYVPHIGADEVGKGDYFGPMVVCACYIPAENYQKVLVTGVGDSKKFSDRNILKFYESLKSLVLYTVKVIEPEVFNELYDEFKNISKLLANAHGENIRTLIVKLEGQGLKYNRVVIDQFSANKGRLSTVLKGIDFDQMHRAEGQDLPTAVASVIARRYFVNSMDDMGSRYDFNFPKGATDVINQGKEFVDKYGSEELVKVAKVSFRTTAQILS
ncbi:ribonuclease HIII [Candidatus Dojkabacteria bacterium]|nr:ribonuclease HIII [Candidatus Dojkabacteria bacterium]